MKKNTKMKSFLSIAAVSAFMLVTLAGCGDGNGSTGTGDAVQAGVTSTSNTGTSKNTLVFAGEGQSVLNPLLNNTDDIQSIIFSGLMKYDGTINRLQIWQKVMNMMRIPKHIPFI